LTSVSPEAAPLGRAGTSPSGLSLPEELLLIALRRDGRLRLNARTTLPYGLARAVLIELALRRQVGSRNDELFVEPEAEPLDDELLTEALEAIMSYELLRFSTEDVGSHLDPGLRILATEVCGSSRGATRARVPATQAWPGPLSGPG
jgi:Golgi phosphoprotein 3 (GPP34)